MFEILTLTTQMPLSRAMHMHLYVIFGSKIFKIHKALRGKINLKNEFQKYKGALAAVGTLLGTGVQDEISRTSLAAKKEKLIK